MVLWTSACGADEGRVSLRFEWEATPPAPGEYTIQVDVLTPGGRATQSEAVGYRPGVSIGIPRVPLGRDLVVEVRLVEVGRPGAPPRYFGRSEPFDLRAGEDVEVLVAIRLVDAPTLEDVVALDATGDGWLSRSELRLGVTARGAEAFEIGPDFAFHQGVVRRDAASSLDRMLVDGAGLYQISYDLSLGFTACPEPTGVPVVSCEGFRQVFVRATGSGFASDPIPVEVRLDLAPPEVLLAGVQYLPGPGNPLGRVTAATSATRIVVLVTLSEPIDGEAQRPQLTAGLGPHALDFVLTTDEAELKGATSLEFEAVVDGALHPSGVYVPRLSLRDLAGNTTDRASFAVPAIDVDVLSDPLVVKQDQVSYVRSPLVSRQAVAPADGSIGTEPLPADTFAFDGERSPALLRFWSTKDRDDLMGQAAPQEEGWARSDLELVNLDTPSVFVTGVDRAGNESAPVRLENAWFVASSAASTGRPTPHVVSTSVDIKPPRADKTAVTDLVAVSAPDGESVVSRASHEWIERGLESERPLYAQGPIAYDAARGRIVRLAYEADNADFLQVWEWDGLHWERRQIANGLAPAGRRFPSIAYDSARGRVILFGGIDFSSSRVMRDVWEWDGERWYDVTPSGASSPSARYSAAMAYDSRRRRTVLFGGHGRRGLGSGRHDLDDTWEWDGKTWTELQSEGSNPPARLAHAMAYDEARQRIVLFGGGTTAFPAEPPFGDLWAWDGRSWKSVGSAADPRPEPREAPAMVYDPMRERVVVHGGVDGYDSFRDVWEWDGTHWTETSSASRVCLEGWNDGSLVYSTRSRQVVLQDFLSKLCGWDGRAWTRLTPPSEIEAHVFASPTARWHHAMAFDEARGRTVLFGGIDSYAESSISEPEVWEWNGLEWSEVPPDPEAPGPSGAIAARASYDSARSRLVLLASRWSASNEYVGLWEWDGVRWFDRTSEGGDLPVEVAEDSRFPLEYHAGLGQTVVQGPRLLPGGGAEAVTFGWDGGRWRELSVGGPFYLLGHATAYDAHRDRLVLFGGRTGRATSEIWDWDGIEWRELNPPAPIPSARDFHSMVYDSRRKSLIAFGGFDTKPRDTWEWLGNRWREITPAIGRVPPPRWFSAMTYDSHRGRVVMFGGRSFRSSAMGAIGDTWELAPPGTPGVQLGVSIPDDLRREDLRSIEVRGHCGAAFEPFDASATGARLMGWMTGGPGRLPGEWVELDSNHSGLSTSSPDASLLEYRPPPDSEIRDTQDLLLGDQMFFECRPKGESGTGFAEVALDYLEVRVRYATR